jgi:hypothetical protein
MRPLLVLPALFACSTLICQPVAADPPKGAPATPAPAAAAAPDDAAARHAKRTACLKEAKTRKLLGAQKSAFLKDCFAAP